MKTKQILIELNKYLSPYMIELLKIQSSTKGSIILCCGISDIIKEYKSTKMNEAVVSALLTNLCKNNFS